MRSVNVAVRALSASITCAGIWREVLEFVRLPLPLLGVGRGAFLTIIFGQIFAYSAFSDSHSSSPGEDGDFGEWQDRLVDESPDQETTLAASEELDNRRKKLSDALTVLNKRERRIFETRRLAEEKITLVELAEEFGVSRERVRQIEVSAFAKVQNAVKHRVAAMATPAPLQMR